MFKHNKEQIKSNRPHDALPMRITSLRPNAAKMYIENKEPNMPVMFIIIGNIDYRFGNIPYIKSPE